MQIHIMTFFSFANIRIHVNGPLKNTMLYNFYKFTMFPFVLIYSN